jgi:hypothetical protein
MSGQREHEFDKNWTREGLIYRALNTNPYEATRVQGRSPAVSLANAERALAGAVEHDRGVEEAKRALESTKGMVERTVLANGLAFDMMHDKKVAKQVFRDRDVAGYDSAVVNMASEAYLYLKKADRFSRQGREDHATDLFKVAQRVMLGAGGIDLLDGYKRGPRVTSAREAMWKAAGSVKRRFGRRKPRHD